MNIIKKHILLIILINISLVFYGQEIINENQAVIEEIIEEIASESDEELDYTSLFDDLNYFINNPLNLNFANETDLEKIQILTEYQIKSLLYYRKNNGNFISIYELQLVDGYTPDIIQRILPFVMVSTVLEKDDFKFSRAIKYGKHQVFIRSQQMLEEQKGYIQEDDSSGYLGNNIKLYTKYKYNYKNKIAWGFTSEKDPGEEFFSGKQQNGFDYYSAHIQINNIGRIKTLSLGDYQLKFGQGLAVWSGMASGKSSYVMDIKKKAQGIKKYSSTDENKFFRGVATTITHEDFDFTVFFSKKKIDANIVLIDTIAEEVQTISSLQNTGYHRTYNEIDDKDAIGETLFGGNISFNREKYKIGLTYLNYNFSADLKKTIKPYNQFEFQGSSNSNISFDYQFAVKDIYFFGEIAHSKNNAIAYINGATTNLAPQVSLSVLHRNYPRNYQAYYSGSFSENTRAINENGLYIGTEIHPIKKWKISAYFDTYKFPWLKFGVNSPSHGYDYLTQIDYFPTRYLSMYIRFKNEIKQKSPSSDSISINDLIDDDKLKLRYHISYKVSESITLKNRIEISKSQIGDNDKESGYLIYQDVQYSPLTFPLKVSFRYAVFDTDSYDTRIYAYENDILYAFSIPAYYSKGTRMYITLKYSVLDNLDVWFRYAQTYFSDKDIIGTGLNEIQGNTKSEVKFQIRYKF